MIRSFPEIDFFFKANEFSNEDLDNLLKKIEDVYLDYHLNKKAKSLIKLELMKFEMQKKEEEQGIDLGDKIKKNDLSRSNKTINKSGRETNKKRPSIKEYLKLKLTSIKSGHYRNAAKELEYSASFIFKILKKKGYPNLNQWDQVESDVFKEMKSFVIKRLHEIYRFKYPKKSGKPIRKLGGGSRPSPGVYGQIEQTGLGKVIYIRSK